MLFLGVIFTPKVPLFGLAAANTIFRLDTAVSILFSIASAIWIGRNKPILVVPLMVIFVLFIGVNNENNNLQIALLSAGYATIFVCSLLMAKNIGEQAFIKSEASKSFVDILLLLLAINSTGGMLSRLSGLKICQDVEYNSLDSTRCLFDEYGVAGAPYISGAFAVAIIIMATLQNKRTFQIIGVAMLMLSDSRAFAASFIPLILYLLIKSNFGKYKYILIIFGVLAIPFIETKTVSGFSSDQLGDQSYLMRLMIYYDYLEWLNASRLLIGSGANAFLEFAIQYDMPGHPDNLYIRLLSEIGVLGVAIFFAMILYGNKTIVKKKKEEKLRYFLYIIGLFVLGLAQESLMAVKAGHMLAFILGYLHGFRELHKRNVISIKGSNL